MSTSDFRAWFDERMDRLETRLDKVLDTQTAQHDVQTKQAADIAYHIRRTDAVEKWVEALSADVHPIKEHVARLKGVMWFVGAVGGTVAFVVSLWKAFRAP